MTYRKAFPRIGIALLLLATLSACTVVPAYPYAGRQAPVYVDTYPSGSYGRPYGNTYYYGDSGPRRDYDRGHYREPDRRAYQHEAPRHESTIRIPSPLEVHRNVRRSLGLPRLPGMP